VWPTLQSHNETKFIRYTFVNLNPAPHVRVNGVNSTVGYGELATVREEGCCDVTHLFIWSIFAKLQKHFQASMLLMHRFDNEVL